MKLATLKKVLAKHWDEIVILLITVIILATIFIPFFFNNSLDKFDTPGLLSLSWFIKEHTLPDFSGWNPFFFGGFPQGVLYPPLFHWVVALLGKIFHLSVAYKLVITIAASFIPFSIYEFSLKIYKEKTWALLNTVFILLTLIILPGYLGFNFDAILDYGLGPNFVTIPFFFGYLALLFSKKKNITAMAVVFSLMLLTNLVAPFALMLITAVYVLWNVRNNKGILLEIIKFGLLCLLFVMFWIVPFVLFQKYSASGLPPMTSNTMLSSLAVIGTVVCMIFAFWKKGRNFLILLVPAFLISILTLIDSVSEIQIPPIHPFRLQIFSFISIASTIAFIIKNLHPTFIKIATKLKFIKYIKINTHVGLNFFSLILILILLAFFRLNPNGPEEVTLTPNLEWQGRIARAYKVSEVLDQSRSVIDKSVIETEDRFAVDGLLKESSYLAPYFQSLTKSLNPDNFDWEELDQNYIENYQLSQNKAEFLANLLWVKSLFVIDESFPRCTDFQFISNFKSNTKDEGLQDRSMYICALTNSSTSNFVEMITSQPNVVSDNWDRELENWWESESLELFTDEPIDFENDANFNIVPQVEFSTNYQQVFISTGVEEEHYYIIKMSYFPKWKAYDKDGNEVKIYRTSPNLMIVPIKEEVTLKYEMTTIEWVTFYISVLSWISLIVISFYVATRRRFLSKKTEKSN